MLPGRHSLIKYDDENGRIVYEFDVSNADYYFYFVFIYLLRSKLDFMVQGIFEHMISYLPPLKMTCYINRTVRWIPGDKDVIALFRRMPFDCTITFDMEEVSCALSSMASESSSNIFRTYVDEIIRCMKVDKVRICTKAESCEKINRLDLFSLQFQAHLSYKLIDFRNALTTHNCQSVMKTVDRIDDILTVYHSQRRMIY